MEAILKAWKTSRKFYRDLVDGYTPEQLNKVPDGFSNNLIWNVGHIIVAQQSVVYRLSGLPMNVPEALFEQYKPGTRPERTVTPEEIHELKLLLQSLVERTLEDLGNGKFRQFTERTTATGFHLASLEDALTFNNYHEGLHLGYMMSIRKFV